jgi:hypothetical protein
MERDALINHQSFAELWLRPGSEQNIALEEFQELYKLLL